MNELREIAGRCKVALAADGIDDKYCFLMLVSMVDDDTLTFDVLAESMSVGYREKFQDKVAVRQHVVFKMKRAGIAGTPEDYFARKAREVAALEG